MNLPDFVKSLKFWEGVSMLAGGALALLAFFGKVDPSWAVPTTVILAWILGMLRFFGIVPELRLRQELSRVKAARVEAERVTEELKKAKSRRK